MRTRKVTIAREEHTLCFSLRVARDAAERFGSLEDIDSALSADSAADALDNSLWLLAALMRAGHKVAVSAGEPDPEPLSIDDMYDEMGIEDLAMLGAAIRATITDSSRTDIDADPPKDSKNAKATPDSPVI